VEGGLVSERWRSLLRPETLETLPLPSASEALSAWLFGVLWVAGCVAIGHVGLSAIMPGMLAGGLVAFVGFRRVGWLAWFPPVVVATILLDLLSPLPATSAMGLSLYSDLALALVAVAAVARTVALNVLTLPHRRLERVVLGGAGASALLALFLPPANQAAWALKLLSIVILTYYASLVVEGRPRGAPWNQSSRRLWWLVGCLVGISSLIHIAGATLLSPPVQILLAVGLGTAAGKVRSDRRLRQLARAAAPIPPPRLRMAA
jgi:hypothetical protein